MEFVNVFNGSESVSEYVPPARLTTEIIAEPQPRLIRQLTWHDLTQLEQHLSCRIPKTKDIIFKTPHNK
jgi:hypothetical protein